jgi:hypothetical protein
VSTIALLGKPKGLMLSLMLKLVRLDKKFYTDKESLEVLEKTDSTMMEFCINPPTKFPSDVDYVVIFGSNGQEKIEINRLAYKYSIYIDSNPVKNSTHDCFIQISDLIPSNAEDELASADLRLLKSDQSDIDHNKQHWWVGEVDVIEALSTILLNPNHVLNHSNLHICGRRSWKFRDILSEYELLQNRTKDGQTGHFAPKNLANPKPPGIELQELGTGMVKLESMEEIEELQIKEIALPTRPDLGPLHSVLKEINGEGWRQTQPIRQALMIYLASLV